MCIFAITEVEEYFKGSINGDSLIRKAYLFLYWIVGKGID
jgi:hypothetical protein